MKEIYNKIIMCGDFNIDLLKNNSNGPTGNFTDLTLTEGFVPKITIPTRVTHHSATLIDNIFIYMKDIQDNDEVVASILETDLSDHFPCLVTIPNVLCKDTSQKTIEFHDVTIDKLNLVNAELSNRSWVELCNMSANDAYDHFHGEVMKILDKFVPAERKTVKDRKHKHAPWYTKTIKKYKNKCVKLYSKSLQDPTIKTKYKQYHNSLNRIIRQEKINYYSKRFSELKNDISKTWKVINSVIKKNQ